MSCVGKLLAPAHASHPTRMPTLLASMSGASICSGYCKIRAPLSFMLHNSCNIATQSVERVPSHIPGYPRGCANRARYRLVAFDRNANSPQSTQQPMSRPTTNGKLGNLEDAADSNCKHLDSEVAKIHNVNARKLTSLGIRPDLLLTLFRLPRLMCLPLSFDRFLPPSSGALQLSRFTIAG